MRLPDGLAAGREGGSQILTASPSWLIPIGCRATGGVETNPRMVPPGASSISSLAFSFTCQLFGLTEDVESFSVGYRSLASGSSPAPAEVLEPVQPSDSQLSQTTHLHYYNYNSS